MTATTLAAFALVALVAIATPGPTVLLAFVNGARFGVGRALYGVAGAVASDFVLVGAAALGLGALLAASETAFTLVKWAGAIYLAWLGFAMLRSHGSLDAARDAAAADARPGAGAPRAVFRRSFLVAVTNPKGYLFVSAFLPQFIDPLAPQAPQFLTIAITFAALDAVVMLAYAWAGRHAARTLTPTRARWLDRACGGALIALAGSLAAYRRAAP